MFSVKDNSVVCVQLTSILIYTIYIYICMYGLYNIKFLESLLFDRKTTQIGFIMLPYNSNGGVLKASNVCALMTYTSTCIYT